MTRLGKIYAFLVSSIRGMYRHRKEDLGQNVGATEIVTSCSISLRVAVVMHSLRTGS